MTGAEYRARRRAAQTVAARHREGLEDRCVDFLTAFFQAELRTREYPTASEFRLRPGEALFVATRGRTKLSELKRTYEAERSA